MQILVVMSSYPFPPRTGSAIVAYNCLKYLSRRHLIDLVSLQTGEELPGPAEFVGRVELINKKTDHLKWMLYISCVLMGKPPSVAVCASTPMKEKVKSMINSVNYDAILLFEMNAIQYCPSSSFHKLMVNIEDPQSIKLSRMAELPIWSLLQRAKMIVFARLAAIYENRVLQKVARVLLLSKTDILDMSKNVAYKNLAYAPYGVDQRNSLEILAYQDRERVIVFSGSMYHPPNIDGALFLLSDIFPLILQMCPSAVLWIVGADPDSRIYEAAKTFGKQVVITGKVDDMSMYIKRATVSICPVRLKIGVQTKILEALSWGTPVVTTIAGNSGVAGVSGVHLWAEDDAYSLAKRACSLLQGHDWGQMSAGGRRFVAENFSWEVSAAYLERYIVDLSGSIELAGIQN